MTTPGAEGAEKEAREIIESVHDRDCGDCLQFKIADALKRRDERIKELEKLIEWHKQDTSDAMNWKRELEAELREAKAENELRKEGTPLGLIKALGEITALKTQLDEAQKKLNYFGQFPEPQWQASVVNTLEALVRKQGVVVEAVKFYIDAIQSDSVPIDSIQAYKELREALSQLEGEKGQK